MALRLAVTERTFAIAAQKRTSVLFARRPYEPEPHRVVA
jgi:hypothetical protein